MPGVMPAGLADGLGADLRNVPDEGAPVTVQDTQTPAAPEPQGPARDEQGRFASREPEPVVETAAPAQPDTPPVPQIDWEKRYNDLRSFSDRRYNEATQQLQSYEERIAAIEAQRHAQPTPPTPEYDEYDEDFFADPRVQQFVQEHEQLKAHVAAQRAEAEAAARKAEVSAYIDGQLDRIEAEYKDSLTDEEASMIGNFAQANPDMNGNPDVELAYVTYRKSLEGRKSRWVDTKRSAAAPAQGPAPIEVPDLSDRKARIAYINERIAQGG